MSDTPIVLLITDNGHGLGHLTRMMAVARHAGNRFRPVFLTMSQAYPLVRQYGWTVEYLPSYKRLGVMRAEWGPMFASRVADLITQLQPRVIVIDHIFPSPALASLRAGSVGIDFIWSRRGMWRDGLNQKALASSTYFDLVVEPRDVAGPMDLGVTSEHQEAVRLVDPVVLVSPGERTSREEARRVLGLPDGGRAVLIQLSDSNSQKLDKMIRKVRDVIKAVAGGERVHLFSPLHPLHQGAVTPIEDVVMRPIYPVATHLSAFDGVVTTAGYNSFHEVVESGLPAVFVARDTSSLDDQRRRALFADLVGRGHAVSTVYEPNFREAVRRMLSPDEAEIAQRVGEELGEFAGAGQFADLIASRCQHLEGEPLWLEPQPLSWSMAPEVLERIYSGRTVEEAPRGPVDTVVIVALRFDRGQMAELAAQAARLQESYPFLSPIFLVDDADTQPLDEFGFFYETVMTQAEYEALSIGSYQQYVQACTEGIQSRYLAIATVDLTSGQSGINQLLDRLQVRR